MKAQEFCPFCEEITNVVLIKKDKTVIVRGDAITYSDEFLECTVCANSFDSSSNQDSLKDIIYPQYRKKYNFKTPDEIRKFRKNINLTQKELSDLLGWGGATLSRYENGSLQDDTHDVALHMIMTTQGFISAIKRKYYLLKDEKREYALSWFASKDEAFFKAIAGTIADELRPVLSGFTKDLMDVFRQYNSLKKSVSVHKTIAVMPIDIARYPIVTSKKRIEACFEK